MKRITLLIVTLLMSTCMLYSQSSVKKGLSANLQNSQFGITVPVWLGSNFALVPGVDVKFAETVGTDFSVGLAGRYYLKNEKLCPYFAFRGGTAIYIPSSENPTGTETQVDFFTGLAFGLEYFLTDNLSVGIEAQGNLTQSDEKSLRFGNPDGLNFNTGTMISATIYF